MKLSILLMCCHLSIAAVSELFSWTACLMLPTFFISRLPILSKFDRDGEAYVPLTKCSHVHNGHNVPLNSAFSTSFLFSICLWWCVSIFLNGTAMELRIPSSASPSRRRLSSRPLRRKCKVLGSSAFCFAFILFLDILAPL